jgi:hypothetical protein
MDESYSLLVIYGQVRRLFLKANPQVEDAN